MPRSRHSPPAENAASCTAEYEALLERAALLDDVWVGEAEVAAGPGSPPW